MYHAGFRLTYITSMHYNVDHIIMIIFFNLCMVIIHYHTQVIATLLYILSIIVSTKLLIVHKIILFIYNFLFVCVQPLVVFIHCLVILV